MKSDDLTAALRRLAVDEERRSRPSDADAIITTPTARHQPRRFEYRRRSPLWLAVAAVTLLLALAGALTLLDDDQTVDTTPVTEVPVVPAPATVVSGQGCPFGIAGDPIVMEPGPYGGDSNRFGPVGGQGVAYTTIGSQAAEIHVPGFDLQEVSPWRMEDVELERGTARVWLDGPASGPGNKPFVQVRWFPETQEPCSSFTVTVDGGSEAENRQTAIDLARRIVLPSELEYLDLPGAEGGPVAGLELAGTEWEVMHTSNGSSPPALSGVDVSFTDTTVTWDNGCATRSARYELDRDDGILTLTNPTSTDPGCTPPTFPAFPDLPPPLWPVVDAVMDSERIPANLILGELWLGHYPEGSYIVLEPR